MGEFKHILHFWIVLSLSSPHSTPPQNVHWTHQNLTQSKLENFILQKRYNNELNMYLSSAMESQILRPR